MAKMGAGKVLVILLLMQQILAAIFLSPKSKISEKFYAMVSRFREYKNEDIIHLDSERLQTLLLGGKDALAEPNVLQAFSILYEDLLPVRFGGDILFNLIDKSIEQAKDTRQKSSVALSSRTEAPISVLKRKIIDRILKIAKEESVDGCVSSLFPILDVNSDGYVSKEEFSVWVQDVIITDLEMAEGVSGLNALDEIYSDIDVNNDGSLSVEELQAWTTGCVSEGLIVDTKPSTFSSSTDSQKTIVTPKSQQVHARYKYMVDTFALAASKWEDKNPTSLNRVDLVALGCFTGAKVPGVVRALEILYEDYVPLRLAGDLIFKMIEKRITA